MLTMLANVDIVISAIAVCAVSASVPESVQPWRWFWCWDLMLFLSAVAAYALLAKRFKIAAVQRLPKVIDDPQDQCTETVDSEDDNQEPEHFGQSLGEEVADEAEYLGHATEDVVQDTEHFGHVADCVAQEIEHLVSVESTEQQHQPDASDHLALMRKYASERNIQGTLRAFRELGSSVAELDSSAYNTVLQAWINCGNIAAAEDWMEKMRKVGMVDSSSFGKLIKTFVATHQRDRASSMVEEMRDVGISPTVDIFNELLNGCAQESHFDDGLALLNEMHSEGVKPNIFTLDVLVKLLNSARNIEHNFESVVQILRKYEIDPYIHSQCFKLACADQRSDRIGDDAGSSISPLPLTLPRLAAVILYADYHLLAQCCVHEVHVTGSLPRVKAARKSCKQYGFLDKDENQTWPLNGHWETEHGLTVIIEGKIVRWSRQRASKLRFAGLDRRACILTVYGEAALGRLVTPGSSPGATKTLRWNNGDVWHSYDGRIVGHAALFAQSMTKILRDESQDAAYRARTRAILTSVSKQGLNMPAILMDDVLCFLGHDLYYVRIRFESKWSPDSDFYDADEDIFDTVSRRHPQVGLRHCWADQSTSWCGQRTLVNGESVEEECFNRHINALWRT
jgi:pentatricopeptide repeat protein